MHFQLSVAALAAASFTAARPLDVEGGADVLGLGAHGGASVILPKRYTVVPGVTNPIKAPDGTEALKRDVVDGSIDTPILDGSVQVLKRDEPLLGVNVDSPIADADLDVLKRSNILDATVDVGQLLNLTATVGTGSGKRDVVDANATINLGELLRLNVTVGGNGKRDVVQGTATLGVGHLLGVNANTDIGKRSNILDATVNVNDLLHLSTNVGAGKRDVVDANAKVTLGDILGLNANVNVKGKRDVVDGSVTVGQLLGINANVGKRDIVDGSVTVGQLLGVNAHVSKRDVVDGSVTLGDLLSGHVQVGKRDLIDADANIDLPLDIDLSKRDIISADADLNLPHIINVDADAQV